MENHASPEADARVRLTHDQAQELVLHIVATQAESLARGELTKPLTVHAHGFSKSAREKIESAGGTCQIIES